MLFRLGFLFVILTLFNNSIAGQGWKSDLDSAKFYETSRSTRKAIEFYKLVKEKLPADSAESLTNIQICQSIGTLMQEIASFQESISYFEQAGAVVEKKLGSINVTNGKILNLQGISWMSMGNYPKAETLFVKASDIYGKADRNDPGYFRSYSNLASVYTRTNRTALSIPIYLDVIASTERISGKEGLDYSRATFNIALAYENLGAYEEALSYAREAVALRKKLHGEKDSRYFSAYRLFGTLLQNVHKLDSAILVYSRLIETVEENNLAKADVFLETINNLALVYETLGEFELAERAHLKAMNLRKTLNGIGSGAYASSCINTGGFYESIGQYEKAEKHFLIAKQIWDTLKTYNGYRVACSNLGRIYRVTGNIHKSLELTHEASVITAKDSLNHPGLYAMTLTEEAATLMASKDYQHARPLLVKALSLGGLKNNFMLYSTAAAYYYNTKDFVKAKWYYWGAVGDTLQRRENTGFADCYEKLGLIYWQSKNYDSADWSFQKALTIRKKYYRMISRFANEWEQGKFLNNVMGSGDILYSFYSQPRLNKFQPGAYELSLFQRNLLLSSASSLKKWSFNNTDSSVRNLYSNWISAKRIIADIQSKGGKNPVKLHETIDSANAYEKKLQQMSSEFKRQTQDVSWTDIRGKLKPDEAAIEFNVFRFSESSGKQHKTRYIASIIRKDSKTPTTVLLFEEDQLKDQLSNGSARDLQQLYTRGILPTSVKAGVNYKRLFDLIWNPLQPYLKNITTVYFSPSGLLHRVSFAAIPIDSKQVLSDRYNLVQLNSTAAILDEAAPSFSPQDNMVGYGGLNYDQKSSTISLKKDSVSEFIRPRELQRGESWSYLAGTKKELDSIKANAIKTNHPIVTYTGTEGTETSFKDLEGQHSPSIIHIATHGYFFPDPTPSNDSISFYEANEFYKKAEDPLFRCGLLFAGGNKTWKGETNMGGDDGILTAYEISTLYFPNTRLAILSACETALGDVKGGEGVYGLQRSFKLAGVTNLVMSLWKVPDEETVEFMQTFYEYLFTGKDARTSFRFTQESLKRKYRKDPYKWAAWVFVN